MTRLIAFSKGGTLSYVGTDHLGGTIKVADATFTPLDQMRYFTFGASRDAGTSLGTDHLFTSQIQDASIGLYWYRSRAYDPAVGRFCAPDSIVPDATNPQALNRYSFNINNPLRYVDPTGHIYDDPSDGNLGTVTSSGSSAAAIVSEVSGDSANVAAGIAANDLLPQRYQLRVPTSYLNRPTDTQAMIIDMSRGRPGRGAWIVRFDRPNSRIPFYHLNANPELTGQLDPHLHLSAGVVEGVGGGARLLRAADRVAVPFAVASDAVELGNAYVADDYALGRNTRHAGGDIAGGWAGALAGAWAGAEAGALIGGAIGAAPGAAIGGIIGGIIGGVGGGFGGSALGGGLADGL